LARYGRALARSVPGADEAAYRAALEDLATAAVPSDRRAWIADEATPVEQIRTAIDAYDLKTRIYDALGMLEKAAAARAEATDFRRDVAFVAGTLLDAEGRDKNPNSLSNQGKALRDKRNYAEAVAMFDRALVLDEASADIHYDRGTCYLKIGNFVPGILDFSRALEINPRFSDQFYNKVYQVSYVVDLNRVITELNKIVADHPDVSCVVFLRGFFYVAKTEFKKYDKADLDDGIRDFDRTLELNPKHISAYIYRGFLHYKGAVMQPPPPADFTAKEFDAALADYKKALELDPQSGIAHFLMAQVYSARDGGDIEKAVRELTIAIEDKQFKGFDRIKNDKGFANVKDDPRVVKLIEGK
jgi:tetratricopeptide (TPR) repeat protein